MILGVLPHSMPNGDSPQHARDYYTPEWALGEEEWE